MNLREKYHHAIQTAKGFKMQANDYMKIFEANKGTLTDPDKIKPGQVLTIPVA